MKNISAVLLLLLALIGCNNNQKSLNSPTTDKLLKEKDSTENSDIAQRIANANGFESWKDVSEIAFTFNVDRGDNHFERSWVWNRITGDVSMMSATDSLKYNRSQMDSLIMKTDGAFINDKYWLLAPYQIVWDEGTTISEKEDAVAPISKDTLNQLTIVYGNEGGYTPGDAYDFFYDKDFKIREWNYRKGNSEKPSMSTTWENYENFNGIEIAKTHKDSTGNFKLYFTNISVKKEGDN
ncbi:hypothetical protein [Aequorivita lipolytica]|uniref:Selenophosphate synthetase n=1 Tax=Aequorivita lipolytica TaxID=153267 RepID=A0A5C6YM49_9FLAO|nr:hypothetical protein [Aequorivita lipolytica]TXD68637.1 hypothetical protein ESV24_10750 [Aequorivita lipolytica]SRX53224.1 hypothetical protein AEQU2_02453 [Aequorivita lipolytica]